MTSTQAPSGSGECAKISLTEGSNATVSVEPLHHSEHRATTDVERPGIIPESDIQDLARILVAVQRWEELIARLESGSMHIRADDVWATAEPALLLRLHNVDEATRPSVLQLLKYVYLCSDDARNRFVSSPVVRPRQSFLALQHARSFVFATIVSFTSDRK